MHKSAELDIPQLAATVCWTATFALLSLGCDFQRAAGNAMGTSYSIQANCPESLPVERIDAELARINGLMSTYDPDSELSRFNRQPMGAAVSVSDDLVEVVATAFAVAEQTGGAFDATVAPLVSLWGFGAEAAPQAPSDSAVAEALRFVDYRRVAHQRDPSKIEKLLPATLDLSAIAKGFAVDRLGDVLDDAGCPAYLIEFGGEIGSRGQAPGGGRWVVGVESPAGPDHIETVRLRNAALATSGDYRQYRESDGIRVSHIIDPRTGYPIRHRLASVTVVADSAMVADAYATALLVMGETEARDFATEARLAALFVVRTEGGFDVSHSDAMIRHLGPG